LKPYNSAVVEARIDIRILAALARYFRPQTKSALVRQCLEEFYTLLCKQKNILPISSTTEALGIFNELGLGSSNRTGRGRRELTSALTSETEENLTLEQAALTAAHRLREREETK